MLYLFAGDDFKNKILAYEKFINSISSSVEKFSINRNNFDPMQLESFYSGNNLFFDKCVILFSGILEREETHDFILNNLNMMRASENSFVFLERSVGKLALDAFTKTKGEVRLFELPKAKKEKFNNFLLANALGQRDRLNLWIYYRQAVGKGVGLEELVGVLFWKIKDMILKNDFRKFSRIELQNSSATLSYLLPKSRKEGQDPEVVFEKFLLKMF